MAERVGRGSLTGRWEPRPEAYPNIRGGISIERDLPAGTKLWFTGWTKAISGGQVVSVLVEIADECREAVPDANLQIATAALCAMREANITLRCDGDPEDAAVADAEAVPTRSSSPAAERMRLHRKRRRRGVRCLRTSLHVTQIDGLIRKGFLKQEDRGDLEALQCAIDAFISTALDDMA
jgi:hypothetical protein